VRTKEITYFLTPRGGETFPELLIRAKRVLNFIEAKHPDGNILLATHGDIGKMIYAAYYGLDWETALSMFHLGNCELLALAPGVDLDHSRLFKLPQHNG
jgi:broad specificity phosphatase PhoE